MFMKFSKNPYKTNSFGVSRTLYGYGRVGGRAGGGESLNRQSALMRTDAEH